MRARASMTRRPAAAWRGVRGFDEEAPAMTRAQGPPGHRHPILIAQWFEVVRARQAHALIRATARHPVCPQNRLSSHSSGRLSRARRVIRVGGDRGRASQHQARQSPPPRRGAGQGQFQLVMTSAVFFASRASRLVPGLGMGVAHWPGRREVPRRTAARTHTSARSGVSRKSHPSAAIRSKVGAGTPRSRRDDR